MTTNEELFARASRAIPGGVSSPVRAFGAVGGTPYFVAKAEGPHVWDVEGRRYIDLVQSYGAIVLVFQHGVGIGAFNAIGFQFQQVDAIEAWIPLLLFSILFGLSMDYHVFLLSRIREEYDKTLDNDEAVAYGLRTTAGIITGAALIMVVVFTAFAAERLVPLQQMGFGLAVAVFMDATIVRSVLVPASMKLLGDRNWYFPRWLEWIPRVNVEGHEPELRAPGERSASGDPAGNGHVAEKVEVDRS